MSENNFSLDELKSTAASNEGDLLDTSTTKVSTGPITEDFAPISPEIKEVEIADIMPYKKPEAVGKEFVDSLFNDLDKAVDREKERITELQNKVMEQEAFKQMDEEVEEKDNTDDIPATATKVEETNAETVDLEDEDAVTTDFSLSIDEENFFKDLEEEDDDIEEEEEESEVDKESQDAQINELKDSLKGKITPIAKSIDLSKYTISKKPVSIAKLLSIESSANNAADWVLYSAKRPISMSELSGTEIEKIDPRNSNRNRVNMYKDIYSIIYKHVIDANKPPFEAWLKTLRLFDVSHIYFALYKACFAGANSIPYSCPKCGKTFMIDTAFEDMVKYATPEIKEEVAKILANDTTTETDEYEVTLKQISDNYVVALKDPSVYEVVFETGSLSEEFTEKYKDLLGLMVYIDGFYLINNEDMTLSRVDTKPDPNNIVKTTMRKVKIFYEILSSLSSAQYFQIASYIKEITDRGGNISYKIPAAKCPKCNHDIPEEVRSPEEMLFTRHQLAAIVTL